MTSTICLSLSVRGMLPTATSRWHSLGLSSVNKCFMTNWTNRCRHAEKNVKDAYNWLAGIYEKGDRIYLFGAPSLSFVLVDDNGILAGFSRGAYQVRALASMIHEVMTCPCIASTSIDSVTFTAGWSGDGDAVQRNVSVPIGIFQLGSRRYCNRAYNRYLAIDPHEPESRRNAVEFKKRFCWQGVRIHFVGVWCATFLNHTLTP